MWVFLSGSIPDGNGRAVFAPWRPGFLHLSNCKISQGTDGEIGLSYFRLSRSGTEMHPTYKHRDHHSFCCVGSTQMSVVDTSDFV